LRKLAHFGWSVELKERIKFCSEDLACESIISKRKDVKSSKEAFCDGNFS